MGRELWIVFRGKEPTTAHLTEDAAKEAAINEVGLWVGNQVFSIWSARLDADPSDPGIPVLRLKDPSDT